MSLVDFVAIAPFWIELVFGGQISLGVLRMLRMTRIFRVLKVGSFADDLKLFTDGMSHAAEGLVLLFFLLVLYFCVFSTLIYMFEYEAQKDCRMCSTCGCPAWRGFTSIPTTMYFIMATMTTVGYGDMYPITVPGQITCGLCMLCSVFALGLPIVVIGVGFEKAFKVRRFTRIVLAKRVSGWCIRQVLARACRMRTSSKHSKSSRSKLGRQGGRGCQSSKWRGTSCRPMLTRMSGLISATKLQSYTRLRSCTNSMSWHDFVVRLLTCFRVLRWLTSYCAAWVPCDQIRTNHGRSILRGTATTDQGSSARALSSPTTFRQLGR